MLTDCTFSSVVSTVIGTTAPFSAISGAFMDMADEGVV
jgi:hypothetical protein